MKHETLMELASCPMVQWDAILTRWIEGGAGFGHLPPEDDRPDLQESIRDLDAMIQRFVRFQAYASARHGEGCGDQGHDSAVEAQNKAVRKVRRVLGYTYPQSIVTF